MESGAIGGSTVELAIGMRTLAKRAKREPVISTGSEILLTIVIDIRKPYLLKRRGPPGYGGLSALLFYNRVAALS